jgi:hypothetical protein
MIKLSASGETGNRISHPILFTVVRRRVHGGFRKKAWRVYSYRLQNNSKGYSRIEWRLKVSYQSPMTMEILRGEIFESLQKNDSNTTR